MTAAPAAAESRAKRRDGALIVGIIAVMLLTLAGGYAASWALMLRVTETHALHVAAGFTRNLAKALAPFDADGRFVGFNGEAQNAVYRFAREVAHIDRIIAIGRDRVVAFDSADEKTGQRYDKPYIAKALEQGKPTIGFADPMEAPQSAHSRFIAETYMPVRSGGVVVGVFELYLDVADYVAAVREVFAIGYAGFAVAVLLATAAAVTLVTRSMRRRAADYRRMAALRDDAEDARQGLARSLAQQKRFTANAAHELRTPLAVLRARLDGLDSPEAGSLTADVDRMARLVEQLLSVARLEARMVELEDDVDLRMVARNVAAALFPLALNDGKSITVDAPEAPVMVRGSVFALEDALRNLIDNALRHSPPGGAVEVTVAEAGELAAGELVVVELIVGDRGPGLPAALRDQLFEPFVHGPGLHGPGLHGSGRRGGAGLGLAIVAETAALHGGVATAADRAGGGAEFRLSFPRPRDGETT